VSAPDPSLREQALAEVTGPGGWFETVEETVLGEPMPVFRQRMRSLREMVADAAKHGDAEFLVMGDDRVTYADLPARVASVARELERRGVGKGDRVAILAANSPDWVLTFFATVSLGGVVAALNGWWTAEEIRYGIELADPVVLVGDERRLDRVAHLDLAADIVVLERDRHALHRQVGEAELPTVPIDEDDPALILFTSGTTGRAKGAVASHRGIIGFVQTLFAKGAAQMLAAQRSGAAPAVPGGGGRSVTLMTSPLFHVSGLYGSTMMGLATGGKLVFRAGRFDPEDVLRLIEQERVTSWGALGSMGPRVVDHPRFAEFDVSSVTNVGFGGAPASPDLQRRIRDAFPNAAPSVSIGYGSSESVAVIANHGGAELEARPTSTGWRTPTTQIEIRDAEGDPLPPGVEGEIHVRSPYVMLGYFRNPEATEAAITSGRWLATGDIGHLDEHGYLFINSRARDMILRAAENIYPVEIEHRLEDHPAVEEAAVVGVDHPELGQEVKAVVVLAPGASVTEQDLAAWAGETLAPFKVPSLWELRGEPLPRNAAGKVVKGVLTGERDLSQHEE
jgi:long-chain acyl-CoA synthetase